MASMRSWLLAVFVLQLLWNVAGIALVGQAHAHAEGAYTVVSLADVQANEGKGLTDGAHGLADEVPDLSDTLLRRAPGACANLPHPAHRGQPSIGQLPPWLEGVFRPPTWA